MEPPPADPADPADPSATAAAVRAALARDPEAAEFLLALLTTAAFSPRFASLLDPVPVPARYLHAPTRQVDIALLRADLRALPPLAPPPALTPPQAALLAHALFRPGGTTPLLSSAGPDPHLAREASRLRRPRRFAAPAPAPATTAFRGAPTAFHGAPPDRWYSILRNGLRVPPAVSASNGRLFGDAAYLAAAFGLALAFAPHQPVLRLRASRVAACSVVGEFAVEAADVRDDVPDGYVVAQRVAGLRLEALSALVEVAAERAPGSPGAVHEALLRVWRAVGGFGVVALLYVLALLAVGRR